MRIFYSYTIRILFTYRIAWKYAVDGNVEHFGYVMQARILDGILGIYTRQACKIGIEKVVMKNYFIRASGRIPDFARQFRLELAPCVAPVWGGEETGNPE